MHRGPGAVQDRVAHARPVRNYMTALDNDDPPGGVGETLQIDETCIGGKATGGSRTTVRVMLDRMTHSFTR